MVLAPIKMESHMSMRFNLETIEWQATGFKSFVCMFEVGQKVNNTRLYLITNQMTSQLNMQIDYHNKLGWEEYAEKYFVSDEEWEMTVYFLDFQEIWDELRRTVESCDRLFGIYAGMHAAQSLSLKAVNRFSIIYKRSSIFMSSGLDGRISFLTVTVMCVYWFQWEQNKVV